MTYSTSSEPLNAIQLTATPENFIRVFFLESCHLPSRTVAWLFCCVGL